MWNDLYRKVSLYNMQYIQAENESSIYIMSQSLWVGFAC